MLPGVVFVVLPDRVVAVLMEAACGCTLSTCAPSLSCGEVAGSRGFRAPDWECTSLKDVAVSGAVASLLSAASSVCGHRGFLKCSSVTNDQTQVFRCLAKGDKAAPERMLLACDMCTCRTQYRQS